MVGGLVENQQVGFGNQHIGQGHTLLLSATQLPHGLMQVANLQLGQNLLGLQHLLVVTLMIETGIQHGVVGVENRRLFQESYLQITLVDDVTRIITVLTRQ